MSVRSTQLAETRSKLEASVRRKRETTRAADDVRASGVLANDADPDGQRLSAQLGSEPLHGTVTLRGDGSFVYTPDADFVGIDEFSYVAQDGLADSPLATVSIDVRLMPAPGIVELATATQIVDENAGTVTVELVRRQGSLGAIDVSYQTRNGTAIAGKDFNSKRGTIRFADGETSKQLVFTIRDDTRIEADEAFRVELTKATRGATIGSVASSEITIRDNERTEGPTVLDVLPVNAGENLAAIVLTFDGPMNSASVTRKSSYVIRDAGGDGVFSTRDDSTRSLRSVVYDKSTFTATLTLSSAAPPSRLLRLDIRDRSVLGDNQLTLDGNADGQPGGLFQKVLA